MARFGRSFPIQTATIIKTKVGRNYAQILSESITTSETIVRNISRTLTESALTATSSVATVFVRLEDFTETAITITDLVIQKAITRIFSDSITISEAFSKILGYVKSLSDSSTITDTQITMVKTKSLTDSINLTEYFTLRLNGLLAFWHRTSRTTGTWTKKAKDTTASWTRIGKS